MYFCEKTKVFITKLSLEHPLATFHSFPFIELYEQLALKEYFNIKSPYLKVFNQKHAMKL